MPPLQKLGEHILQVTIVLSSSTQVQQFNVMNVTTSLLFCTFFSVYIGSWQTKKKGTHCHILCVYAALIKSTNAVWLCIISSIFWLKCHHLPITHNVNLPLLVDNLLVQYISCIPNFKTL